MWHGHPNLYMHKIDEILNTPDDSDIGYFVKVDLKYSVDIKEKQNFAFAPEKKVILEDKYNEYMKQIRPKIYTKTKKVICDWTDEENYSVHYSMLKLYIRHGMVVEKIHEINSIKQSKWLEKYVNFTTQKRNRSRNDFEKDFFKLLNHAFYGETMEKVRNRMRLELI